MQMYIALSLFCHSYKESYKSVIDCQEYVIACVATNKASNEIVLYKECTKAWMDKR